MGFFFLKDLLWLTRRSTVRIAWTNTTTRNTKTPPPRWCWWRTRFRCAMLDSSSSSRENNKSRSEIGLMERLTDILVNEGDGDLLLQQSDWEDRVLQWSVLGQGREQYGAMIGNDENSGFMGFALLGLWVSICCVFFLQCFWFFFACLIFFFFWYNFFFLDLKISQWNCWVSD